MAGENTNRTHMSGTLKNIIIGIVTTVAASAIVWWLGFNNSKADEKEKQQEATYKALATLDKYDHLYAETMEDIDCRKIATGKITMNSDDEELIIGQIDNNISTISDLKNEPDIDIDLKALLQRRITFYTALKNERIKLMSRITAIAGSKKKDQEMIELVNKFQHRTDEIQQTELLPTYNLYESIEKKYGKDIPGIRRTLEINNANLIGQWNITNASYMKLQDNGKLISKVDAESFTGTWKLNKDTLKFTFDEGGDNDLLIKQITKKQMHYKILGDSITNWVCRN